MARKLANSMSPVAMLALFFGALFALGFWAGVASACF